MPYSPDDPKFDPAERQVRTTAQTAIGARLRPDHPGFWPDARIDLTDARLIGLDFSGITVGEFRADHARFDDDAKFGGATFNTRAWFRGASFSRDAGFDQTTFHGDTWFHGATFKGNIRFSGARFHGDAEFGEARFRRDHPPVWPVWPEAFAEPAGLVWVDPDPDPPAAPPNGP
ncbi:pentapeptide repeat-containing protein [Catenulispora subtropica]